MIHVTIDGRRLTGRPGETILDVARRSGITIPALCAEERLEPFDACGVCSVEVEGRGVVRACSTPIADGMAVQTGSPAAREVRKAALELLLSNHWGDCVGPCQEACPAHTDCQAYVSLAANGRFEDGLRILYESLPLPASFGRICPAPCEDACRREVAEEPVQIREIKRFLGDLPTPYVPSVAAPTGKRVAVVGGGPAGLSAAYFLRRRGHEVVVIDAMPLMGGMLRYGIPEYRLPAAVIDREVAVLEAMGIVFRHGVRLGKDVSLEELEAEFDAVFLGLGAWGTHPMGLPGEDHPAVTQGTDFLRQVNEGARPRLPKKVVVVGGGNTAMDAARCARRLGADVTVVYRRSRDEMPALPHEVEEAVDEGVQFRFLTQPVEFLADDRSLTGIRCLEMQLGPPDDSGRRRPVPVAGSEFDLEAGAVLLAVGQSVDAAFLRSTGVELTKAGTVVAEPTTGRTSKPNVFAGGDAVTGPSIAVEAVGAGHRAAEAIDRYVRGGDPAAPRASYVHVKSDVTREDLGNPVVAPRVRTSERTPAERLRDFGEYEAGFTAEQAMAAGQRCLECGCLAFHDCALREYATEADASQDAFVGDVARERCDERHPFILREAGKCVSCGRCVRVCRELCGVSAIDFVGRGIEADVQVPFNRAWQDSDCVSCGACVDACPTGALSDRTVLEKQVPLVVERTASVCSLCGLGCDLELLSIDGAYLGTVAPEGGVLCARGRYGWHALREAQRITTPRVRRGSRLVDASWDDAFNVAAERLAAAKGSVAVIGTGLLTCEEGWVAKRIADLLASGSPVFDVRSDGPRVDVPSERLADLSALATPRALIVVVGPRSGHEKVVLDVMLRRAMQGGALLYSVGGKVPGAHAEIPLEALPALLEELRPEARTAARLKALGVPPDAVKLLRKPRNRAQLLVVEERTVAESALDHVVRFVADAGEARLIAVPASSNAVGLRRLGFGEALPAAKAWLCIGADPVGTQAGRQRLLGVETLVAASPIATATTERADVVLPMRWPFETRGRVLGAAGETSLVPGAQSAIEFETWQILAHLSRALGNGSLPSDFEAVSQAAMNAVRAARPTAVSAGGTAAALAAAIDRRLAENGIR